MPEHTNITRRSVLMGAAAAAMTTIAPAFSQVQGKSDYDYFLVTEGNNHRDRLMSRLNNRRWLRERAEEGCRSVCLELPWDLEGPAQKGAAYIESHVRHALWANGIRNPDSMRQTMQSYIRYANTAKAIQRKAAHYDMSVHFVDPMSTKRIFEITIGAFENQQTYEQMLEARLEIDPQMSARIKQHPKAAIVFVGNLHQENLARSLGRAFIMPANQLGRSDFFLDAISHLFRGQVLGSTPAQHLR